MIDSVKFDIRAMLIKLADRLHNMRTLSSMRPEKQMKIAGETDYFYAPLANRLGLFGVKIELENLRFKYRCPREYAEIEKMIEADKCAEKKIAKAAAKLTYAFANATVPKVNVIVGEAFGSAYVAMNSKAIGADITMAYPDAKIGSMDAKLAARIICDGQGADAIDACAKEYAELQNNVTSAAKRGYVDQIIEPVDTRKYVIGAFEMLLTKSEDRPAKKHGTV